MASFRKRNNRWEVRVRRNGYPTQTKTFTHKADAQIWAKEAELALERGALNLKRGTPSMTLDEAITRYIIEVAIFHKGKASEEYRLRTWKGLLPASKSILNIKTSEISAAVQERLSTVSPASVRRELNLISSVFEKTYREWLDSEMANPVRGVKRPPDSPRRDRRLTTYEKALLFSQLAKASQQDLRLAVMLALETGMRLGEIAGLRWASINFESASILLKDTKNGSNRRVILSKRAHQCLEHHPTRNDRVFSLTGSGIQQAFRKVVRQAGIADLRFHDLRHEAISSLFEKGLTLPEVQSMSGHRTLDQLMRYSHADSKRITALLK